jgi:hypothetical protein
MVSVMIESGAGESSSYSDKIAMQVPVATKTRKKCWVSDDSKVEPTLEEMMNNKDFDIGYSIDKQNFILRALTKKNYRSSFEYIKDSGTSVKSLSEIAEQPRYLLLVNDYYQIW